MKSSDDDTTPQDAAATIPVATAGDDHDTAHEATSAEPQLPWCKLRFQ